MYVEIIQDFQPLLVRKMNNETSSRLPLLTNPNAISSTNKSPISTSSKGVPNPNDVVNQKSILKQKKIKQQYDEIYNHTNQSKRLSKTSYRKLNCIYGEEDDNIVIKRKRTDLSSLYSRMEKRKYPSQFKLGNIPTDIAREIENRDDKVVRLSGNELKQLKNIYRKGVTIDKFKNISVEDKNRKEEVFDLFKKKKPVKNFLFKKQSIETQVYEVIEKDFKPVLDLAGRQIKLSQEAMEREVMLEFSKDFKIVEPFNFTKEFRTCEEIIEFEKNEELKRLYKSNFKRQSVICDILDNIDRGK
jgi:hypothetical protein